MIRMHTNKYQVARHSMRIASDAWYTKRIPYARTMHDGSMRYKRIRRIAHTYNTGMRYSRRVSMQAYRLMDLQYACAGLKDRSIRKNRLARCRPYAYPGGYLIVSYTDDGSMLCPFCACVHDIDQPDSRIVARETIDYATDGYCDPDYDDTILTCDQCERNMVDM